MEGHDVGKDRKKLTIFTVRPKRYFSKGSEPHAKFSDVGSSLWILGEQNILFVKVLNKVPMSILL